MAEARLREELALSGEAFLVRTFLLLHRAGRFDDRIPQLSEADTIVTEYAFKFGRADIVIFHVDGSATVIEAKDGLAGYNSVVSGIGQAGLYAAQLAEKVGAVKRVQRALMWASNGNLVLDALIEDVCAAAGVIAMPYASVAKMKDGTRVALKLVYGGKDESRKI